jgi:hypothetical protein
LKDSFMSWSKAGVTAASALAQAVTFVESTTRPARILQDYTQLLVNPSALSAFHSDPVSVLPVARAMPAARAAIKGARPPW